MNTQRYSTTALFVAALFALAGCATLFTGTSDEIQFRTEPSGAMIYVNGVEKGVTPDTVEIKRPGLGDTEVTLEREGYEERVFTLEKEFNAVSVLNFFGILGWGVDIATGAVTKYSQEGYRMELSEEQALNLQELQRDNTGRYLVPITEKNIVVRDPKFGVTFVFTD